MIFTGNKKHLIIGLFLIFTSFFYWFLKPTHSLVSLANAMFYAGNILVFDFLSEKYSGYSLLKTPNRRKHFLVIGLIFGLILEFYFNWMGKFWYYPYWDLTFYILIFIPGFGIYSFYLLETFLGTKAILEHWFLKRHKPISFKGLGKIFTAAGVIGTAGISVATTSLILSLSDKSNNSWFLINQERTGNPNNWYWYFVAFVGLWLLLEFFEYQRHETSMLYELIKGNFWPLISVFVAALISAIIYETFNLHGGLWRYSYQNVPFGNIQFLNFPMMMYVGWPFHYLPIFSFYRLLYKKDTERLMR